MFSKRFTERFTGGSGGGHAGGTASASTAASRDGPDSMLPVPPEANDHRAPSADGDDISLLQTFEKRQGALELPWDDKLVVNKPEPPFVESMRALRSQLLLRATTTGATRLIVPVLSAERGAGKSFVAANLAAVFAHAGARTLLIDADLRFSSLGSIFRLPRRHGLAAILAGLAGPEQILPISGMPTLSVLQAGTSSPNQELFVSTQFEGFIAHIRPAYEVIIVDTTAASVAVDAQLVARKCHGALMVARYGQTSLRSISRVTAGLESLGVPIIGSVLNHY